MANRVKYRYQSLEDYLSSMPLDTDGILDDGWGAYFPVKSREIEAAILFADISSFTRRTFDMSPTETLIFVNNFFAWITAEGLRDRPGIVDKYIGDEMMVIFSRAFGSEDPFLDAARTARFMCEKDIHSFCPHIGIAAGPVAVGYVGTPLKYNCSVFGQAVSLAKRCADIKPQGEGCASVILPSELWKGRDLQEVFPPLSVGFPDGTTQEEGVHWKALAPRAESVKNMPDIEVVELVREGRWFPSRPAEERARRGFEALKKQGRYNRIRFEFELGKGP